MAERSQEYAHLDPLLAQYAALRVDDERRQELRGRLAVAFLPVAENIARRYTGRGEPLDDPEQVATIGLLHALDRYEPTQGRARPSCPRAAAGAAQFARTVPVCGCSEPSRRSARAAASVELFRAVVFSVPAREQCLVGDQEDKVTLATGWALL
ncbi:sigma factor [Actinomycetospora flava]|uniref:Sigma factor n=1 Tax=Actinomycetospora flava TaxID=3129232 RepID=A0ABU8M674_9PSEU